MALTIDLNETVEAQRFWVEMWYVIRQILYLNKTTWETKVPKYKDLVECQSV